MKPILMFFLAVLPVVGLMSCASQITARQPVSYRYEPGRTALLVGRVACAPSNAPMPVKLALAAGNRLQKMPYKWGGGHANLADSGYDCSGTVSYVLRAAGLLDGSMASQDYFGYGSKGEGRWITIYARRGHVFMTIAGLRLDTGGRGEHCGPRWKPETREGAGHVLRHPDGY